MDRAVTYSVVPRKNPRDPEGEVKYYAQAQARGVMSIRMMAERIQKSCTVTRADIMAVLVALSEVVTEGLQNGEIVRLGDLGSFQIGLSGTGAVTKDEYSASQIEKVRINFRPGADLIAAISGLSYQRVAAKSGEPEDTVDTAGSGEDETGVQGN